MCPWVCCVSGVGRPVWRKGGSEMVAHISEVYILGRWRSRCLCVCACAHTRVWRVVVVLALFPVLGIPTHAELLSVCLSSTCLPLWTSPSTAPPRWHWLTTLWVQSKILLLLGSLSWFPLLWIPLAIFSSAILTLVAFYCNNSDKCFSCWTVNANEGMTVNREAGPELVGDRIISEWVNEQVNV